MSDAPETLPDDLSPLVEAMRADVLGPAEVADVARRVEDAIRALPPDAAAAPRGSALGGAKGWWLAGLAVLGGAAMTVTAIRGLAPGDATQPAKLPATLPAASTQAAPPTPAALPPTALPASPTPAHDVAPNEVAPGRAHPAASHPVAHPRALAPRLDPSADADAEHILLIEARRALPSDPARALALAEDHAAHFAAGMLAPEREMIAVDALEALGRDDAARRRATALASRWPTSSYARRVRARGLVP